MKVKTKTGIYEFSDNKIKQSIEKAFKASNNDFSITIEKDLLSDIKNRTFQYATTNNTDIIDYNIIQDIIEDVLMDKRYFNVAREYIKYRYKHKLQKEIVTSSGVHKIFSKYLNQNDWKINENSNMTYSLQGLNNYLVSEATEMFWLDYIYPEKVSAAHREGYMHVHDLNLLSNYCMGWDIQDILLLGFTGVPGKVSSKPPKHLDSLLGQMVNFLYTLQGESAGAQAFSNFDTYLAPFVRNDKLNYKEVKQQIQSFIYNMNVPTRTGFQCVSEDTEALTKDGWKKYNELKEGDKLATFNITTQKIEYLPVEHVFRREYEGKMYKLSNRVTEQLISPNHRVVRQVYNTSKYVIEPIEKILKLKSPVYIPIGSDGVSDGIEMDPNIVKLVAWIISEGSLDINNNYKQITIYQSKIVNEDKYNEIINLLKHLGLEYTERKQIGLGKEVMVIRLSNKSTKEIIQYFDDDNINDIPKKFLLLNKELSKKFIDTYIKGDGYSGNKITSIHKNIIDKLSIIAARAGYGTSIHYISLAKLRSRGNKIAENAQYILHIFKKKTVAIPNIKEVDYKGTIWCPNTKNGTFIARRNGKVFITGNSPFSNVTLDLDANGSAIKDNPVIIGGKMLDTQYKEYQKEMDMINKAFYEVMLEGDSKGNVFTFPIPTINITPSFDWDNKNLEVMWEVEAKYGINYFANFINSDMKPEDSRSMCCRLRLDISQLHKRGGGLFGANPKTGSIGVITISLPMIAYESNGSLDKFFTLLKKYALIAKDGLEAKRKAIEEYTEKGLYPYTKFYLESVKKKEGSYFANHFSTIGIIGAYEAATILGMDYISEEGNKFGVKILDFLNELAVKFQQETDHYYNIEASPAEGASYKLALKAKKKYPKIFTSGSKEVPYFTNSTQVPVDYTNDLLKVLDHQNDIVKRYTGGSVIHIFLGEKITPNQAKLLVKKVLQNYEIPYISLTPTFSICPKHGYIPGEHEYCPKCAAEERERILKEIEILKKSLKVK